MYEGVEGGWDEVLRGMCCQFGFLVFHFINNIFNSETESKIDDNKSEREKMIYCLIDDAFNTQVCGMFMFMYCVSLMVEADTGSPDTLLFTPARALFEVSQLCSLNH